MPRPNINKLDSILSAYRGIRTVTVGSDDIDFDFPVTVRVVNAGNLEFVDSLDRDHTLTGLAAGADVVGPGGALVFVKQIKGASTVTSVIVGIV